MTNFLTKALATLLKIAFWALIVSIVFAFIELVAQGFPNDTWIYYLFSDSGVMQGYVTGVVLYERGVLNPKS